MIQDMHLSHNERVAKRIWKGVKMELNGRKGLSLDNLDSSTMKEINEAMARRITSLLDRNFKGMFPVGAYDGAVK